MVRRARLAEGLSQRQLARLSGVGAATIARVERGQAELTRGVIARLCEALDLASPLGGGELRIALGDITRVEAVCTLRAALREYIAARADPEAFTERRGLWGTERMFAVHDAIASHDAAQALLALLPADEGRAERMPADAPA
jgi:transcriptional regulator with XRE-family HTH domain